MGGGPGQSAGQCGNGCGVMRPPRAGMAWRAVRLRGLILLAQHALCAAPRRLGSTAAQTARGQEQGEARGRQREPPQGRSPGPRHRAEPGLEAGRGSGAVLPPPGHGEPGGEATHRTGGLRGFGMRYGKAFTYAGLKKKKTQRNPTKQQKKNKKKNAGSQQEQAQGAMRFWRVG